MAIPLKPSAALHREGLCDLEASSGRTLKTTMGAYLD